MNIRRTHLLSVLIGLLLSITGCVKSIIKPQLDPPEATFSGINSISGNPRILFIHGMCTHTVESWVDEGWTRKITKYLASQPPSSNATDLPGYRNDSYRVKLYQQQYAWNGRMLVGRFVVWSDLTKTEKKMISFDNDTASGGQFTWKRAKYNQQFKEGLLNDCLSDVAIYAGKSHAQMLSEMKAALCVALDGSIKGTSCQFNNGIHKADNLLIVTESLGSKMTLDAIASLRADAACSGDAMELMAFNEAVAPVFKFFMLANQVPLLDLAVSTPTDKSACASAADLRGSMQGLNAIVAARQSINQSRISRSEPKLYDSPLTLVAFTDPNDLLSYRLPLNYFGSPENTSISVVNVIASNDGTLIGLIENPLNAHLMYSDNREVLKLIFEGKK